MREGHGQQDLRTMSQFVDLSKFALSTERPSHWNDLQVSQKGSPHLDLVKLRYSCDLSGGITSYPSLAFEEVCHTSTPVKLALTVPISTPEALLGHLLTLAPQIAQESLMQLQFSECWGCNLGMQR